MRSVPRARVTGDRLWLQVGRAAVLAHLKAAGMRARPTPLARDADRFIEGAKSVFGVSSSEYRPFRLRSWLHRRATVVLAKRKTS